MEFKKLILIMIIALSCLSISFATNHSEEPIDDGEGQSAGSDGAVTENPQEEPPEDYYGGSVSQEPPQEEQPEEYTMDNETGEPQNIPEEEKPLEAPPQEEYETQEAPQEEPTQTSIVYDGESQNTTTSTVNYDELIETQEAFITTTQEKIDNLESSITTENNDVDSKLNLLMFMTIILYILIIPTLVFIVLQYKKN